MITTKRGSIQDMLKKQVYFRFCLPRIFIKKMSPKSIFGRHLRTLQLNSVAVIKEFHVINLWGVLWAITLFPVILISELGFLNASFFLSIRLLPHSLCIDPGILRDPLFTKMLSTWTRLSHYFNMFSAFLFKHIYTHWSILSSNSPSTERAVEN